jgi:hypothetical protein
MHENALACCKKFLIHPNAIDETNLRSEVKDFEVVLSFYDEIKKIIKRIEEQLVWIFTG